MLKQQMRLFSKEQFYFKKKVGKYKRKRNAISIIEKNNNINLNFGFSFSLLSSLRVIRTMIDKRVYARLSYLMIIIVWNVLGFRSNMNRQHQLSFENQSTYTYKSNTQLKNYIQTIYLYLLDRLALDYLIEGQINLSNQFNNSLIEKLQPVAIQEILFTCIGNYGISRDVIKFKVWKIKKYTDHIDRKKKNQEQMELSV
ncbi:unnamed protein product [Paramecium octaurelia]|uniref:Transmembrane protein n=1 Tax=Paramecium octaurelia TaxID=43137 RepID=A0A8S1UXJ2_PAROT|nr:unnamed protein product [Paramecium octaurelia]